MKRLQAFWLAIAGTVFPLILVVPAEAQFAQQAQSALQNAMKVAINAPQRGLRAGSKADIGLQLQNGKNEAAALPKDTHVELQFFGATGEVVHKSTCIIMAGAPDTRCPVEVEDPGLYKILAVPKNHQLLEGSGYVYVKPDKAPDRNKARQEAPLGRSPGAMRVEGAKLVYAAYRPVDPDPPATHADTCGASKTAASVILRINEGAESGGAFRAGLESAQIQAFFEAEDGGSAPSDVLVWLSPDHGAIDHEPLIIPRCSVSGQAALSSKYPVHATIAYSVIPKQYAPQGNGTLQASFIRPILGIAVLPEGEQTLSLIDNGPIVAQFFDANGDVVPSDSSRTVTFVSNNSVIGTRQQSVSVKSGDYSAANVILPFWLGRGTIFVTADQLQAAAHPVAVVGLIVILVCLIGGVSGGLVSFLAGGGPVYKRLLVGMAAGIVLSWAYVFGILPKVDTTVAHNYVSVFVVSLLGGYLGIKGLDLVLKRLGWS